MAYACWYLVLLLSVACFCQVDSDFQPCLAFSGCHGVLGF